MEKECVECGQKFETVKNNKKYCTPRCRYIHGLKEAKQFKEEVRNKSPKTCPICKRTFTPNHMGRVYCSPECAYEYFLKTKEERRLKAETMSTKIRMQIRAIERELNHLKAVLKKERII